MQIIDVRLIQLSYSSFKLVAFQTPDWIYSPFGPRLKLAWLVEIANIHIRGEFLVHTNRRLSKERKVLLKQPCFFYCISRFLASQAGDLITQGANNVGNSFGSCSDCWSAGKSISIAYWRVNKSSESMQFKCSTMVWSWWILLHRQQIYVW